MNITYFSPRQPYKTHQELGTMAAIRAMPNSSAPKLSLTPKRKVSWVNTNTLTRLVPPLSSEAGQPENTKEKLLTTQEAVADRKEGERRKPTLKHLNHNGLRHLGRARQRCLSQKPQRSETVEIRNGIPVYSDLCK